MTSLSLESRLGVVSKYSGTKMYETYSRALATGGDSQNSSQGVLEQFKLPCAKLTSGPEYKVSVLHFPLFRHCRTTRSIHSFYNLLRHKDTSNKEIEAFCDELPSTVVRTKHKVVATVPVLEFRKRKYESIFYRKDLSY